MPGTYAVFGLGLADERYFPLVEHYMKQVDEEHQSVQNYFTAAFVDKHGVNAKTIPTLTICLLHGTDSMNPKLKEQVEEEANLAVLLESIRLCESYQVEHLVYIVWGGVAKLKSTAAKAKGEKADMLKPFVTEIIELLRSEFREGEEAFHPPATEQQLQEADLGLPCLRI